MERNPKVSQHVSVKWYLGMNLLLCTVRSVSLQAPERQACPRRTRSRAPNFACNKCSFSITHMINAEENKKMEFENLFPSDQ